MAKNHIITGLDIGTSAIKALTVLKKKGSQDLEVLSRVLKPNSGMRRGVIVKPEEVSRNIASVLDKILTESGKKIEEIYVNVGGSHIFSTLSRGSVVVSRADQKISQEDIERVIQTAKTFSLPPNKEIVDFFPRSFIVDEEFRVKEPLGMQGIRMEAEILAIGVFSPYFKNLTEAVLNTGVQIADIICNPVSSAKACLTPQQKELGVVLLDIGAGTTDISIYEEGDLVHLGVIPIGSSHITNDIAIGLRTDTAVAERIKKEFGNCFKDSVKKNKKREKIEIPSASLARLSPAFFEKGRDLGGLAFSSKFLNKIIEARVCEIFDLVRKEIKKSSSGILPAGIVITGGGVKLPGIVDLAKRELKLPCRIGIPVFQQSFLENEDSLKEDFGENSEKDPSFSTAWGLVLSGIENSPEKSFFGTRRGIVNKIKKVFRVFIP